MRTPTCPGTHAHACTHRPISSTYCFSTATMIRERASVLRYTYIVCLVSSRLYSLTKTDSSVCTVGSSLVNYFEPGLHHACLVNPQCRTSWTTSTAFISMVKFKTYVAILGTFYLENGNYESVNLTFSLSSYDFSQIVHLFCILWEILFDSDFAEYAHH
jgi:hypothetical protein